MRDTVHPLVSAFYLPQFHPIPVNDAAWGPGFTEWDNVRRARPRFVGHEQPAVPGELGYYDLRDHDVRAAQMRLAADHGIDAFCWYHYWFQGERPLRAPLDRMIADPSEDLPFMLCWANESWTRAWSGQSGEVILRQRYSSDDDEAHIRFLLPILADERYVRVDERPVLLVYRPTDLPAPQRTMATWRAAARAYGLEGLQLLGVSSFRDHISEPARLGLDGTVEQQPNLSIVRPWWRAAPRKVAAAARLADPHPRLVRYAYGRLVERALARTGRMASDPTSSPTVCPAWDNSPRRQRGAVVLTGSTVELYETWLERVLTSTKAPLVFVNAWNEWGEGAYLEPDERLGRARLLATRRAVERARRLR